MFCTRGRFNQCLQNSFVYVSLEIFIRYWTWWENENPAIQRLPCLKNMLICPLYSNIGILFLWTTTNYFVSSFYSNQISHIVYQVGLSNSAWKELLRLLLTSNVYFSAVPLIYLRVGFDTLESSAIGYWKCVLLLDMLVKEWSRRFHCTLLPVQCSASALDFQRNL